MNLYLVWLLCSSIPTVAGTELGKNESLEIGNIGKQLRKLKWDNQENREIRKSMEKEKGNW